MYTENLKATMMKYIHIYTIVKKNLFRNKRIKLKVCDAIMEALDDKKSLFILVKSY